MKSLSLIQAIFLFDEETKKEPRKRVKGRAQKNAIFEPTKTNMAQARQLAHRILGRADPSLPLETTVVLLLIEQMILKKVSDKSLAGYRFTLRELEHYTGWSMEKLKMHLTRLESLRLININPRFMSLLYQSQYFRPTIYRFAKEMPGQLVSDNPKQSNNYTHVRRTIKSVDSYKKRWHLKQA